MQPTTFLILVDATPAAHLAARYAARLAAAVGGRLVLVPLETTQLMDPTLGQVPLPAAYYQQQQLEEAADLSQLLLELPAPVVLEAAVVLLPAVLQGLLTRWQPRLLVLGVVPEHDVMDYLMLNQGLSVLRQVGLPVLLVPNTTPVQLPQRVAVASSGKRFHLAAAARDLRAVLGSWHASYAVVHVASTGESAAGLSRAVEAVTQSGLLPLAASCTTYCVRQQPCKAGILQATRDTQADLLVLPTRPSSLLGSVFGSGVAAHVARTSSVPVLLLPTTEGLAPVVSPALRAGVAVDDGRN